MAATATCTLFFNLFILWVCCAVNIHGDQTGLQEDEPVARMGQGTMHRNDQSSCPRGTICVPVRECRLLLELMDRSCLMPSRLKELTCGYRKTEVLICCPGDGSANPFDSSHHGEDESHFRNRTNAGGNKLNENCGRPRLNGWENGFTGIGSQPWVARIGYKEEEKGTVDYPCCGSVITNKVILTAAHCAAAEPEGYSLHSVRVGDYDGRTDPDCTSSFCAHPVQDMEISDAIVHPGFVKGSFGVHDLALIILKTDIQYSVAVQPICLLQNPNIRMVGRKGKLVGWGKLAGQDVVPQEIQQIDLPVIPLEYCMRTYDKILSVTSSHLCVGGEPKKDGCRGFGGAPFVMLDHFNRDTYYQVGMVSFGSDKCGAAGIPSVYTRIQSYYEWIAAKIPA